MKELNFNIEGSNQQHIGHYLKQRLPPDTDSCFFKERPSNYRIENVQNYFAELREFLEKNSLKIKGDPYVKLTPWEITIPHPANGSIIRKFVISYDTKPAFVELFAEEMGEGKPSRTILANPPSKTYDQIIHRIYDTKAPLAEQLTKSMQEWLIMYGSLIQTSRSLERQGIKNELNSFDGDFCDLNPEEQDHILAMAKGLAIMQDRHYEQGQGKKHVSSTEITLSLSHRILLLQNNNASLKTRRYYPNKYQH